MKTNYIFDFDGTLVDSFPTVIKTFTLLADECDFYKIKPEEVPALRDLTSQELMKFFRIPLHKIPGVIFRIREVMHAHIPSLKPFENLPQVLQTLTENQVTLGILTSNSENNVATWLKHHELQHLFKFIHSEPNFFGKDRVLKELVKSHGMDKAHTFYVGDETRDIEAAHASGVQSIAVTWGFNSEKVLKLHQPSHIAREPGDLIKI